MSKGFLNRYPKFLIRLGAAVVVLVAGVPIVRAQLTASADNGAVTDEISPLAVETLTAELVSSYDVSRSYTGNVTALRSSDLGFPRGGELVTVFVDEGARVSTGQPLAQLDTQNLQAQRQQLEAQRDEAQARLLELSRGARQEDIAAARAEVRDLENQLQLQEAQRSRREFLYNEGAIAREQLDEFAFGSEVLGARLDRAESQLSELLNGTRPEQIAAQRAVVQQLEASIANVDIDINKSTLKAPFDGIISSQQFDEGAVVSAGQPIVRLVENATPEARIGMPVDAARALEAGDVVGLSLGGDRYEATVTFVLPEIDPDTRTQTVIFQLQAALSTINPGQTIRVELTETIPTEGFWLPIEALTQDIRGLWSAYVVVPDETNENQYHVQAQSVEILHEESDRALVQGTIQPGDRIVASGVHRLVPGQSIDPIE